MKKRMILSIMLLFAFYGMCFADAPHQIGGFILGKHIKDYKDLVNMESAIPIRHRGYLHELETDVLEGFKIGYIWIGNCLHPGRIVRIELKYLDSTKEFYDSLLQRFKKKFGEPSEWRGDPFHIVISWKWSFVDQENNHISLILQHNTKDLDEKIGNTLKLSMTNMIEEERRCFTKKADELQGHKKVQRHRPKNKAPVNWDIFIPR